MIDVQIKMKTIFIILLIFCSILSIATAIVQTQFNIVRYILKLIRGKTDREKSMQLNKISNIGNRINIDYKQCIGKGVWSNVYLGKSKKTVFLQILK